VLPVRDNSLRIDAGLQSEALEVDGRTRGFGGAAGGSANRTADDIDWVHDNSQPAELDELFPQWEFDLLHLSSFPKLGS
jgi:hypothetical protein